MIYELMKRDPAWPAVRWLVPGMAVLWFVLSLFTQRVLGHAVLIGIIAVFPFASLSLATMQESATDFLSALPVTFRQIYVARVFLMELLVWTPVLAGYALSLGRSKGAADPAFAVPLLAFGAFASLLLIGTQSAMLVGLNLPRRLVVSLLFAGTAIPSISLAMPARMARFSGSAASLCIAASVAIFIRTWSIIGTGIPVSGRRPRAIATSAVARPSRLPAWLTRLRFFYSGSELLFLSVLFVQTFTGNWFGALLFCWAVRLAPMKRWLDPLPVSRRPILWAGTLPFLIALVAGYTLSLRVGAFQLLQGRYSDVAETTTQTWPPSAQEPRCGQFNVMPPLEYWRVASAGRAPAIVAPWGETFEPPVLKILGTTVFNPYAAGCANSRRFFDWEFNRATTAVYGKPASVTDFVHDRHARAIPGARLQLITLGVILNCAMLSFTCMALKDWRPLWRRQRWFAWILIGSLAAGALVTPFWIRLAAVQDAIQWLAWHLPENPAVVITICAAGPLILYWPLNKFSREAEYASAAVSQSSLSRLWRADRSR